ncbi:Na(+)/H(+) antiporter subunit C [Georgenia alba]|uniref:Na(+)/H(+) antiporter subunit C n=1 Tax=Georgenia alba TaxID=2233858 RepID=A0ABW2Q1Z5_9MICO
MSPGTFIDVSPSLALVVLAGVLVGTGVYLLLERSLTRVVIGIALLSNGVNVLVLIAGGRAGGAPIIGQTEPAEMSDPLPQAMILTAIVITLGLTSFLLAMAYRSWQLNGHDEVQDDLEDRRIAERAARDELSERATDDAGTTLAEDAATTRDEMETGEGEHADEGHHPAALGAHDREGER